MTDLGDVGVVISKMPGGDAGTYGRHRCGGARSDGPIFPYGVGNRLTRRGDRGSGERTAEYRRRPPVYNWIALTVMIAKIIPDVAHDTRAR